MIVVTMNPKHLDVQNSTLEAHPITMALKIGLDHSLIPPVKGGGTHATFIRRLNKHGYHKNNPIEITDLPPMRESAGKTIESFAEKHSATVRIYSAALELTEFETVDAYVFIYLYEASPGMFKVIFKPHCLQTTASGKTYSHHCNFCNTSHQNDHSRCTKGHTDRIKCNRCPLKYKRNTKHECWHKKCPRCRVTCDVRTHECYYVAPTAMDANVRIVSFDVRTKEDCSGNVTATEVEAIDDEHHVFTLDEFLALAVTYMKSKETVVFVCASTDDLSLLFAAARKTKGMYLMPTPSGGKIIMLKGRGVRFLPVKSIIDVPLDSYRETFRIPKDCTDPLEVRHRGQLAYIEHFLGVCGANPFSFNSKAALSMYVYKKDHMPEKSIPIIDKNEFEIHVGGGLNTVGYSQYTCDEGEQIDVKDIDSMYPSIMMTKCYPKGQPLPLKIRKDLVEKITGACLKARPHEDALQDLEFAVIAARNEGKDTAPYKTKLDAERAIIDALYEPLPFGMLQVEIEPPSKQSLRHALLKVSGKHQFQPGTITVCTPELYRAIGLGYTLVRVVKGRVFRETTTTLFESFVKVFWKMKIEAGGFKRGATKAQQDKFIEDCLDATGIELDRENIRVNPGLRQAAKQLLNTLWGKFAQNSPETETSIVPSGREVKRIFEDKRFESVDCDFISDTDGWLVVAHKKEQSYQVTTNKYIAAFTTSYGRLKLYNIMHWLGDQYIYGNTDSCYYVIRDGGKVIPTGQFLGEMKNELAANRYITRMTCSVNSYIAELNVCPGQEPEFIGCAGGTSRANVQEGVKTGKITETTTHCTKLGQVRRVTKVRDFKLPVAPGVSKERCAGVTKVYPFGYF